MSNAPDVVVLPLLLCISALVTIGAGFTVGAAVMSSATVGLVYLWLRGLR
jgi:hypothetical protein